MADLSTTDARVMVRLKSWLPEYVTGGRPVVLAGQELPARVGGTLSAQPGVLCVGPGEWLLVSENLDVAALREEIKEDLERQGLALVDLSQALAVIRVMGRGARELLSKGCGLDLHPKSFPPDHCARTRFAAIAAIVHRLAGESVFELYVARSHAAYLQSWLADAARDY
ncbi:MAG TPA: sarcosine oxidase subunit gamma family protein [Steroidobacteraceae bacterium]|nr:sarcosine oxidase subunit gamma family protein [Steroidobacteraceae bacterium]